MASCCVNALPFNLAAPLNGLKDAQSAPLVAERAKVLASYYFSRTGGESSDSASTIQRAENASVQAVAHEVIRWAAELERTHLSSISKSPAAINTVYPRGDTFVSSPRGGSSGSGSGGNAVGASSPVAGGSASALDSGSRLQRTSALALASSDALAQRDFVSSHLGVLFQRLKRLSAPSSGSSSGAEAEGGASAVPTHLSIRRSVVEVALQMLLLIGSAVDPSSGDDDDEDDDDEAVVREDGEEVDAAAGAALTVNTNTDSKASGGDEDGARKRTISAFAPGASKKGSLRRGSSISVASSTNNNNNGGGAANGNSVSAAVMFGLEQPSSSSSSSSSSLLWCNIDSVLAGVRERLACSPPFPATAHQNLTSAQGLGSTGNMSSSSSASNAPSGGASAIGISATSVSTGLSGSNASGNSLGGLSSPGASVSGGAAAFSTLANASSWNSLTRCLTLESIGAASVASPLASSANNNNNNNMTMRSPMSSSAAAAAAAIAGSGSSSLGHKTSAFALQSPSQQAGSGSRLLLAHTATGAAAAAGAAASAFNLSTAASAASLTGHSLAHANSGGTNVIGTGGPTLTYARLSAPDFSSPSSSSTAGDDAVSSSGSGQEHLYVVLSGLHKTTCALPIASILALSRAAALNNGSGGSGRLPKLHLTIEDVTDSSVYIPAPLQSVCIRGVSRCSIALGPCASLVHIEGVDTCTITAAAMTVTVRNGFDVNLCAWTKSPLLCLGELRGLRLSPYSACYRGVRAQARAVGLLPALNNDAAAAAATSAGKPLRRNKSSSAEGKEELQLDGEDNAAAEDLLLRAQELEDRDAADESAEDRYYYAAPADESSALASEGKEDADALVSAATTSSNSIGNQWHRIVVIGTGATTSRLLALPSSSSSSSASSSPSSASTSSSGGSSPSSPAHHAAPHTTDGVADDALAIVAKEADLAAITAATVAAASTADAALVVSGPPAPISLLPPAAFTLLACPSAPAPASDEFSSSASPYALPSSRMPLPSAYRQAMAARNEAADKVQAMIVSACLNQPSSPAPANGEEGSEQSSAAASASAATAGEVNPQAAKLLQLAIQAAFLEWLADRGSSDPSLRLQERLRSITPLPQLPGAAPQYGGAGSGSFNSSASSSVATLVVEVPGGSFSAAPALDRTPTKQ